MPYLLDNWIMLRNSCRETDCSVSESKVTQKEKRTKSAQICLSFSNLNLSAEDDPIGHAVEHFCWQKVHRVNWSETFQFYLLPPISTLWHSDITTEDKEAND